MTVKRVLYYLEPSVELGMPLFRYSTFKSKILPEARELKKYSSDLDIGIIIGEQLVTKAKQEGLDLSCFNVYAMSPQDVEDITGDYLSSSLKWYDGSYDYNMINQFSNLIKDVVSGFEPDIVISYEAATPFLKHTFPNSLNLNVMFGAFSRAPFPAYNTIDPCGIYGRSYQSIYKEKINQYEPEEYERETLNILRRQSMKAIAQYLPIKNYIHKTRVRFDKLVLLATQIDDYLAFNACCSYSSQFEMVEDVLENSPRSIGILVTQHGLKEQFTHDQIEYLENNYSNFVFFRNENHIENISQFLAPYVDGVMTVSSSLAYQAVLWKKPFYCLGSSQMNVFSTGDSISNYFDILKSGAYVNKDNALLFILKYCNFPHKNEIFIGRKYFEILNDLYCRYKEFGSCYEMLLRDVSNENVRKNIIEGNREWLLKKTTIESGVECSTDFLRLGMSCSKAVSFDLFDTLVERDFKEPYELFSFIEPLVQNEISNINFKFCHFRRQAESDTRRPTYGKFEVTIDEIYETFKNLTGLSENSIEKIKKIEIDAEIDLVKPKKYMINEFYFAQLLGNSTAIISDIYLEKNVLEDILDKCGITGFDILYSSATSKTRKHNGSLYPEYLKWLKRNKGISADRALHVGDNEHADGKMAKSNGLSTYVFPKAMDNYKRSKVGAVLSNTITSSSPTTSVINGVFANKFYSAHWNYVLDDSVFDGTPYNYGYKAIGPLVLGFVQWLFQRLKQKGIKDVYFLARDGWLLKKVYDEYYSDVDDKPRSHYMYCSRRAVILPSMEHQDDILELASQSFDPRTIEDLLSSRFGVSVDDIPSKVWKQSKYNKNDIVSSLHDQKRLMNFLKASSAFILEKARIERESYLDYLNEINFISSSRNGEAAVVDIGYSGSMQYFLKKMLSINSLPGYYFLTHHHSRKRFVNDVFEGYLGCSDDHRSPLRHPLNNHVFIFEAALSSPEGSLVSFSGLGKDRKINLLNAEEEVLRRKLLIQIHSGAFDFANDISTRFGKYKYEFEIPPLLATKMIFNLADHPSARDAGMFTDFEVENIFGGGSVWLVEKPKSSMFNKNGSLNKDYVNHLIESSKWKAGARAYYASLVNQTQSSSTVANKFSASLHAVKNENEKKKSKLVRDPYSFFNDSKKMYIVPFKYIFSDNSPVNYIATKAVRKILS